MSSIIFTEKVLTVPAENITLRGVSRKHDEDLADYIRGKLREGLTLRGIEERSGGEITHSYLSKILSGAASNPSTDKLRAIAKGLGVTPEEIFSVAAGKPLSNGKAFDSEIAVLFKGFAELSDKDKAELLGTVKMLASEIQKRRPRVTKGKR